MKRIYLVLLLVFAVFFSNLSGLSANDETNAGQETGTSETTDTETDKSEPPVVVPDTTEEGEPTDPSDPSGDLVETPDVETGETDEIGKEEGKAKPNTSNSFGPMAQPESGKIGTDLGPIFDSIVFKINDKVIDGDSVIELDDSNVLELSFNWSLTDETDLKSGDWAKIKVPDEFNALGIDVNQNVPMKQNIDGEEVEIGHFYIDEEGYLYTVFNEELTTQEERKGSVFFEIDLDLKKFEENTQQVVEWDEKVDKGDIKLTIIPKSTSSITKNGAATPLVNPTHIDWSIDVNKNFGVLTDAQIKDNLPAGLELDGTIEILEVQYGLVDGKLVEVGTTAVGTATSFPVDLDEISTPHRLNFSTKIVDYSPGSYKNTTELLDGDTLKGTAEHTVSDVKLGSAIDKSVQSNVPSDAKEISWTIDFNMLQTELVEDAQLDDNIPKGLKLKPGSIKIYELNPSGSNWAQGNDVTSDFDTIEGFPIDFSGKGEQAYRVVYVTNVLPGVFVNDDGEFIKSVNFENEAIFTNNEVSYSDKDDVTIHRSELVGKQGKEVTSYDDTFPVFEWTITVNKAKQPIWNPLVTDELGDGHNLLADSIKVWDANGQEVSLGDGQIITTDSGFGILLGDKIDDTYTITYRTQVDRDNLNQKKVENTFNLYGHLDEDRQGDDGGPGVGTGPGGYRDPIEGGTEEAEIVVENTYIKDNSDWFAPDENGVPFYDGINYDAKTFSWKISVNAIKEQITSLTITDSFTPAKSQYFLKDTLRVYNGNTLVPETEYTVTDNGVEGFVLEFTKVPLARAQYDIYFKSSFDPDVVKENKGVVNTQTTQFDNTATFSGTTKRGDNSVGTIKVSDDATYWLAKDVHNNGKKEGTLDRDRRVISWELYINAMAQELGGPGVPFVIADELQGKFQELDKSSLTIHRFSLDKDGNISVEEAAISSGDYVVKWSDTDAQNFTVTFEKGLDYPVVLKFKSNLVGFSQPTYQNIGSATYDGVKREYPKTVDYAEHDSFISKNALDLNPTQLYPEDEIEWEVVLNTSLSQIKKAKFIDTMSTGLVYVNDSLEVLDHNGEPIVLADGAVTVNHTDPDRPTLTVDLGDINNKITVKYKTVVTAEPRVKISNDARLVGEDLEENNTTKVEYEVNQKPGGIGEGTTTGSIEVLKIDADTTDVILGNEARFELYYYLNGEKRVVATEWTSNGELTFGRLPIRTYYLAELTSPTGYVLSETPHEITLERGEGRKVTYKFENTKEKIDIDVTKVWQKHPIHGEPSNGFPESINVQLYQNDVKVGNEVVLNVENDWKYIWSDLDRTTIDGEPYVYTVEEVDVDDFYDVNITETVDETTNNKSVTITNTYVPLPVSWTYTANKVLSGHPRHDLANGEFNFEIVDTTTNPETVVATGSNDADGNIVFTPVTLSQAGKFNYIVREKKGTDTNITYDETIHDISVTVKDINGHLEVTAESDSVEFDNEYQPEDVDLILTAQKELSGRNQVADEFSFEIYKVVDGKVVGDAIATGTNNADGVVTFSTINYTDAGTYNYVMVEVEGNKDTVDYDDKEIFFTVTVSDTNGKLETSVTIADEETFDFANTYTPKPTSLELQVSKLLEASKHPELGGRKLQENEFKFNLYSVTDEGEVPVQTEVGNNEDGSIPFEDLNFTAVGTYNYRIREEVDTDSTIIYDTIAIDLTVVVEDDKGQLVATPTYKLGETTLDEAVFTNTEKTYAIGDYTWIDANKDGIQDADEVVLKGVIVELYDDEDKLIATTETNDKGLYIFDELVAGTYKVRFVLTEQQAALYEFTQQVDGDNSTDNSDANPNTGRTVDIVLNDDNEHLTKEYDDQEVLATQGIDPTWDAGVILRERTKVSVLKEWVGLAEESVEVTLYRQLEGSDVKEAFHVVELNDDNDWTHTWENLYVDVVTEDGKVNYIYTVEEAELDRYLTEITGDATNGFVITNTRKTYAIGDYTWIDTNKDGIQDEDEPVLPGVIVELYDDEGNKLAETTTDEFGRYLFDELEAGTYRVKFTLTPDQKALYEFTSQNAGDDTTEDSDADVLTGWTVDIVLNDENEYLTSNEDYEFDDVKATMGIDPTWDAGVVLRERTTVTVTKVWVGGPTEKPDVEVVLLRNDEPLGDPVTLNDVNEWTHTWKDLYVDVVTDDGKVNYVYTVAELTTEGYLVDISGDADSGFVVTNTRKTYAIGDYTWIDTNKDGIQDEDEPVLPGVIVELYDEKGNKLAETTTDEKGRYLFDDLEAGSYRVKFTLTPAQRELYEFTSPNAGDDTTEDSDADVLTGWTKVIVLNEDNEYLTSNEDYEHGTVKATMGVDPTWDAGVVLRDLAQLTVQKVWENAPKVKPSVKVQLYRNGEAYGDPVTLNGKETTPWSHTWTNLYVTDENRELYVYTVDEIEVPEDYKKSVDGFVITNTYEGGELPETGVNSRLWTLLGGSGVLMAGAYLLIKGTKREED